MAQLDLKDLTSKATTWVSLYMRAPSLHRWSLWQQIIIKMVRALTATVREFFNGQLSLMAMSLVYTTLLSIVPLLAVSFSVLKGFGVHNQIEPFLLNALAPLGEKAEEISMQIIGFVDNVKVGVLGAVGLGLLFYTVISLMTKIERAFNYTWHVSAGRSLADRFSHYISVLLLAPVLVFAALSIMTTITASPTVAQLSQEPGIGTLITWGGRVVPYVIMVGAFGFVYTLMPNTNVKISSALAGAVVTALLWQLTGWAFTSFVIGSPNAEVYAAFFTLVVFMIWLYISWLILLIGGSIGFYYQNTRLTIPGYRSSSLSNIARERLALSVMKIIAENFRDGDEKPTIASLSERFGVPDSAISWVVGVMNRNGLLARIEGGARHLVPARSLETITVRNIYDAVRRSDEGDGKALSVEVPDADVRTLLEGIDSSVRDKLGATTLLELCKDREPAPVSQIG